MSDQQKSGFASKGAFAESDLARLDALLAAEGLDVAAAPVAIPGRPGATVAPQSHAQELLWLVQESAPDHSAYNMSVVRKVVGPLDITALERSLAVVVERHEALRTTFAAGDPYPIQQVQSAATFRLEVDDVRSRPEGHRAGAARAIVETAIATPFDLRAAPAFRALVVRLSDTEAILAIVSHHIVVDGWSLGIFWRELSEIYTSLVAGRVAELPALPISYGDFAAWERATLVGERLERTLRYWRAQLDGAQTAIALPVDRPRHDRNDHRGAFVRRRLSPAVLATVRAFAQANGATLYMVLVAAYQAWLSRVSGQDDIVIGSAIGSRPHPETHGVIGYFSGALPIRSRLADDPSFTTLVRQVRDAVLGALEFQDVPVERLTLELARDQALTGDSLFQVVLTMGDTTPTVVELGGCRVEGTPLSLGSTKFDLTLFPAERADGLWLSLSYRTGLFDEATAVRMLEQLETLLVAAVHDPAQRISMLPLLSAAAQAELASWNDTAVAFDRALVPSQIVARAAATPRQVAVRVGDATLTYGDLLARATGLAHALRAAGVTTDSAVGLCLDRSPELLIGVLGIWLAGGAYVPLLPELPVARISQQIDTVGARCVVTSAAYRHLIPASIQPIALDGNPASVAPNAVLPAILPESLAYVLFTSGSTGSPKGVAVTHANLAHYTAAIAHRLGLAVDGSMHWHCASVSTLAADLGNTAVFPALASGGTLHLVPSDIAMDTTRWQEYLAVHPLDLLKITPSHLRALVGDGRDAALAARLPARWLVVGGEACPWSLVDLVRGANSCRILNHYGPTEATVGVCTFEPDLIDVSQWAPATVPIGQPLANATASVFDRNRQLAPVGVSGELHIGGAGVARGYFGRDDLTAERFFTDLAGKRWYRTGDRVRRLPTGDLEFLGRLDAQVKVRGYRVELEEIEAALGQCPQVRHVAVALHDDRLIGYVVGNGSTPAGSALEAFLAERLPDYMIPQEWAALDALPITPNGKLDRRALLAPTAATAPGDDAPTGRAEIQLAALWSEVLKRPIVSRHDNFFSLGGHSLLAIRLLARISKMFGVRLPIRALFDAPTVAELAPLLVAVDAPAVAAVIAPAKIGRAARVVVDPAHDRPAS